MRVQQVCIQNFAVSIRVAIIVVVWWSSDLRENRQAENRDVSVDRESEVTLKHRTIVNFPDLLNRSNAVIFSFIRMSLSEDVEEVWRVGRHWNLRHRVTMLFTVWRWGWWRHIH